MGWRCWEGLRFDGQKDRGKTEQDEERGKSSRYEKEGTTGRPHLHLATVAYQRGRINVNHNKDDR
jgi:hypothetical protein